MESIEAPRKPTLTSSKTMTAISNAGMEPIRRTPSPNLTLTAGSRNAAIQSIHSISSSSRSSPATALQTTMSQLIAPWNRQTSSSEASTNLHSLIRISNSASSSSQMSENKNGATVPGGVGCGGAITGGGHAQGTKLRSILKNSTSQPYSALSLNATPMARTKTSPAKHPNANNVQRKGMTHSTSAPSGTMPTLLFSEARSHVSMPASSMRTKQKRESVIGPGGKPIVGILKHTSSLHPNHHHQHQYQQYQHQYQQYLSPCSARRTSQETVHDVGGAGPNGTAIATTFKIVVDADTIVALQVLEEPDFVLSLQELRKRIMSKLHKSNIVLRDDFELAWVPMNQPIQHHHQSGSTRALGRRMVPLETDEHLFQAMLATPSRKVTLRCSR
ncbi:hypothetical protein DFQ26_004713 [Actinomortierella ambigua]|nr:hypothetical protein DFQ26_004713 [Actinomortierella ambigua]